MPVVVAERATPWFLLALEQIVLGLPVALAAAIPLWAATMAGGLVDVLRGSPDGPGLATVEGKPSSFGVLLSLLRERRVPLDGRRGASAGALATLRRCPGIRSLLAAHDIVAGVGLAVAIGGPLLAAAVVLELAFALVARAASPAQVHALLAPLRAMGLLAIVAIVMSASRRWWRPPRRRRYRRCELARAGASGWSQRQAVADGEAELEGLDRAAQASRSRRSTSSAASRGGSSGSRGSWRRRSSSR